MKTLHISILSFLLILFAATSFAQSKQQTFKVAGVCGMCKKKIETAAKNAGAAYAVWNTDSKELTIKYKQASDVQKIQQSIAIAGYDTPQFKATDDAYNNLHECCKYERNAAALSCCSSELCSKEANCCAPANGSKDGCCKDGKSCCAAGKCTKDMACGEESNGSADCCAKTKSA